MDHNIIRDLLPIYADGLESEESRALIEAHLADCPDCRAQLERMRARVDAPGRTEGADCRRILGRQKRKLARRTTLAAAAALLLGAGLCLLWLWSRGCFDVADRQTSPDGRITTTAYRKNVSGLFPTDHGFTVRDEGAFRGTTNYLDGTSFQGMWWSPDSRYRVIAMETEEEGGRLAMVDYRNNVSRNLTAYLDMAVTGSGAFPGLIQEGEGLWPAIEYRFLQWSDQASVMLLHYAYADRQGEEHEGYFWYDCGSGEISGVMELPEEP